MKKLDEEWQTLLDEYLPLREKGDSSHGANWRYSRPMTEEDPAQGWKLHISATILNAPAVLRVCAQYLRAEGHLFKACSTIAILGKLNAGIFFGFSQVGKCITVYPRTAQAACRAAADLHELTRTFSAPRVPYDLPYSRGSCVHYRYGGFRTIEVALADGRRSTAIRDPSGKLWTDRREPGYAVPDWISNPFEVVADEVQPDSPLVTQFLTYDALSQRGKGGTYLAVDLRNLPAQKCVIKEGRPNGETSVMGLDGRDLIQAEERVLRALSKAGVRVPQPLKTFEVDSHRYLAMEFIEGENLMNLCSHPRRKLPLTVADGLAARIASIVAQIHEAGWVWRDCKPFNLIVSSSSTVSPIDFEGAVRADEPTSLPWGTPGYMPPEVRRGVLPESNLPEDLYALGATLHQLYTSVVPVKHEAGKEPQMVKRLPVGVLRKGVHPSTKGLIASLLAEDPRSRPAAQEVARELAQRAPSEPVEIDASKYRRRWTKRMLEAAIAPLADQPPGLEPMLLNTPKRELAVAG